MDGVSQVGSLPVRLAVGERGMRLQHIDETNLARHGHLAKRLHRQRMGDKHVMTGLDGARRIANGRRMQAVNVAVADKDDGLVKGSPQLHPRTKAGVAQAGVLGEGFGGAACFPAALILQGLRQVPVIEGNHRLNIMRQQFIDQIAIKLHACFINLAAPGGQQARPGDGKAIALQAHLGHQRHVFAKTVIVIDGDIAGGPFKGGSR